MSADFPKHWNLLTLEDAVDAIIDYRGKTPKKTTFGIPLITAKIVKNGRIDTPTEFIAYDDYASWMTRGLPLVGDVIVTTEAPLGEVAQITNAKIALAQRIVTLRGKKGILNNDYLLCVMQSKFVQDQLEARSSGSTVRGIKQSELRKVILPIPPETEQIRIANHVLTLSKKIELNTQTNKTLESIAQAIFKSWFVDFEPVKAKMAVLAEGGTRGQAELAAMGAISGKSEAELAQLQQHNSEHYQQLSETAALFPSAMVDSELGEIPEGWEVSEIGNEVDIVGGGTPSTAELAFWEDGEIHWTTPKDLSNNKSKVLLNTERKITEAGLAKISSGLLPTNTVLMSSRAPVGYLALAKVPVAINQGYIAMKCNSALSAEFTILWAESVMDEIQQRASGTTFAEISKKTFRSIPLTKPNNGVINTFTEKVNTIFNQIASHESQTRTLIQLRDSLLPRLLSGEITVDTE